MIIAIGGGSISTGQTIKIDKFIVSLANKENPKLLFIPTASNDAMGYIDTIKEVYGNLGCIVDSLCVITKNYQDKKSIKIETISPHNEMQNNFLSFVISN